MAQADREQVARRLKGARALRGYDNRKELSAELHRRGLPAVALGELERGQRGLRDIELQAIARGLDVSERWFTLAQEEFDAMLLELPVGSPLPQILHSLARIEAQLALAPEELEQAIADELQKPGQSASSSESGTASNESPAEDS